MWDAMSVVGSFFGLGVNFSPNDRRLVSSKVSFSSERLIIVVFLLETGLVICRGPEIYSEMPSSFLDVSRVLQV